MGAPGHGMASVVFGVLLCAVLCDAQASLPSKDLSSITSALQRDFGAIDEIDTIGMTEEPGVRFDIVAIGTGSNGGWRVEVFSVRHHHLSRIWDSTKSARETEFEMSSPKSVDVRQKEYDYDVLVQGCAPHQCADGVHGFLVFLGKEARTYKAKVVTQGVDKAYTESPKYDVMFSVGITDEAREILKDAMCKDFAITNKKGLPFACKDP